MKINVAIDGPCAAGKSSIAKIIAKNLGYTYIDTGAMYRSVAYKADLLNLSFDDEDSIAEMIRNTDLKLNSDGKIFLDGEDVTMKIRTNRNSLLASKVSALKKVREELVHQQQKMALEKGVVMDGRDIGTVVLPDAELKIYQTATIESRALRRYKENLEKGIETDLETLKKEIERRDYNDSHRENSPLKKAEDAIELDTSNMSIDEVEKTVMEMIKGRLEE